MRDLLNAKLENKSDDDANTLSPQIKELRLRIFQLHGLMTGDPRVKRPVLNVGIFNFVMKEAGGASTCEELWASSDDV